MFLGYQRDWRLPQQCQSKHCHSALAAHNNRSRMARLQLLGLRWPFPQLTVAGHANSLPSASPRVGSGERAVIQILRFWPALQIRNRRRCFATIPTAAAHRPAGKPEGAAGQPRERH